MTLKELSQDDRDIVNSINDMLDNGYMSGDESLSNFLSNVKTYIETRNLPSSRDNLIRKADELSRHIDNHIRSVRELLENIDGETQSVISDIYEIIEG